MRCRMDGSKKCCDDQSSERPHHLGTEGVDVGGGAGREPCGHLTVVYLCGGGRTGVLYFQSRW